MKKFILTIVLGLMIISVNAQIQKLEGPRVGVTMITAGSGSDYLHKGLDFVQNDDNRFGETGSSFISQYGWQWESRFADGGGNVTGIVEWIALVGGMEKGKFLPSVSSVIGARTSSGFEVGVGPILSLSVETAVGVGMVFAIGKNFKSGNLNLPVNLVFMPGKSVTGKYKDDSGNLEEYTYNTGSRISLMIGFNLAK